MAGAQLFDMQDCAGVRLGSGLKHISGLPNTYLCVVLVWIPGTDQYWELELRSDWGINFSRVCGDSWRQCSFIQLYQYPSTVAIPDGRIDMSSPAGSQRINPPLQQPPAAEPVIPGVFDPNLAPPEIPENQLPPVPADTPTTEQSTASGNPNTDFDTTPSSTHPPTPVIPEPTAPPHPDDRRPSECQRLLDMVRRTVPGATVIDAVDDPRFATVVDVPVTIYGHLLECEAGHCGRRCSPGSSPDLRGGLAARLRSRLHGYGQRL